MHSGNFMRYTEHFVTLFDNNYMPMGLCLHRSLMSHGQPFHLWILCMDDVVEGHLRRLALANTSLIPLREVEDARLLAVKPLRTRAEYCWTLTPFAPEFVFQLDSGVQRVTYIDADLFFFNSPKSFFRELEESGKHVLITEHAYDPRYDQTEVSGRFCVQFITFRRTDAAGRVLRWWQERCLEWCYARPERDRFGDQKYLDQWPSLFEHEVHILRQTEKTLAPWNVNFYYRRLGAITPVFYHFHTFRLIRPGKALLCSEYRIGRLGRRLAAHYVKCMTDVLRLLNRNGIDFEYSDPRPPANTLREIVRTLIGRYPTASVG